MSVRALELLKDVKDKLRDSFSAAEANVIIMTDNFSKWNPGHAKADVLVHYSSLEPKNVKHDSITLDIYAFIRNYAPSANEGVFFYTDKIRTSLSKWVAANSVGKLRYEGTSFEYQKEQIWCYRLRFSTTILSPTNV